MSPEPLMIVNKCSARKPLSLVTEVLDVKNKTKVRQVGAAKSKSKAIREVSMLWSIISKRKGHKKTNEKVKKYLYN